jgi:hypothetical protein
VSTLAANREASKKAPLNFLYIDPPHQPSVQYQHNKPDTYRFKLYVSFGGGVSRFLSMIGMSPRISAVVSAHAVPGPKATGWGVDTLKGAARRIMEVVCALSIICEKPR